MKLNQSYKSAYAKFESHETEKPFFMTASSSRYFILQDDDKCWIFFRTTKKLADPETGKKRYHVWSLRYVKTTDSMKLTDHKTKAKLIDTKNTILEMIHDKRWEGKENAPAFVPRERKELSPERKAQLSERGKELVKKKQHECPFCFEKNFSLKLVAVIVCRECEKSFAIGS